VSRRLLYLERADRGDRLSALRLLGPRTSEVWRPADAAPGAGLHTVDSNLNAVRDGAAWVRERLTSAGDRSTLSTICLDPDGTLCSWLTAPSNDPTILHAVARGVSAGGHDGEHDDHAIAAIPTARALDHFGSVGSGMSLQSLTPSLNGGTGNGSARATPKGKGASDVASRRRLAVLGVPDSAAGILVDTLDALGVPTPPAISLWHAMAQAWDPASPSNARTDAPHSDRLVAEDVPVTAIVLIEPQGRLTWAWSRAGTLLTGGSMRLPRARLDPAHAAGVLPADNHMARVDPSHAARLSAEWLSWSAQTGAAPGRVILLATDRQSGRSAGLSPAELAASLVKAWPGAVIDVITDEDPVTLTLRRTLEDDGPATSDQSITALSTRPGRAHRSMYTWLALAIAGLALGALAVAVMSWRTAADARQRAETIRRETQTAVLNHYNDPMATAAGILVTLQDDLARLENADAPTAGNEFMPVMQELETVALVVSSVIASSPGSEFRTISIDNLSGLTLQMRFPDIGTFEDFRNALNDAGTTRLAWDPTSATEVTASNPAMYDATFRARWQIARPGGTP